MSEATENNVATEEHEADENNVATEIAAEGAAELVAAEASEAAEAPSPAAAVPARARAGRLALAAIVMLAVVALDQLSKAWARAALAEGPMTFIPGILDFNLTFNTGAAFSIGQGKGLLFVAVAVAVAIAILVLVWREPKLPLPLLCALACVAGGGLGNMIDRVALGKVTDFIATAFIDFPIFNVADMFVTCGVVVAIILIFMLDKE